MLFESNKCTFHNKQHARICILHKELPSLAVINLGVYCNLLGPQYMIRDNSKLPVHIFAICLIVDNPRTINSSSLIRLVNLFETYHDMVAYKT